MSSSRSQRLASSMTWLETSRVAPASASWRRMSQRSRRRAGSESHGRLVEDEQLGLADEGGSQGDSRQLPAGEVEHAVGGIVGEVHRGEDPLDLFDQLRLANPDDLGEVAHVLLDCEVAVDARRLGEVADPVPQRRRPGWFAEDSDRSAGDDLDTDDGAHERGLATAVGTE